MASDWERRGLLPKGLSVEQVELTGDRVLVHAFARSAAAACPRGGRLSRQVHSRYRRGLTDLPAHGREVMISLAVRRFRYNSASLHRNVGALRRAIRKEGRRSVALELGSYRCDRRYGGILPAPWPRTGARHTTWRAKRSAPEPTERTDPAAAAGNRATPPHTARARQYSGSARHTCG